MNNNYMCVDESTWEEVSPKMDTVTEIPWEYKEEGDELIGTYLCKRIKINRMKIDWRI